MYPKLTINLEKLEENLEAVGRITKEEGGCSLMIVTKALCADHKMTDMVASHPMVDYMADSRMENIRSYVDKAHQGEKETVLLRLPMMEEIEEVVSYADISFNSELTTLNALNEEAKRQEKVHKVVLMIDLGDLREGIFFESEEEIFNTVEKILAMKNLSLYGIGVNLTCYGAIIPTNNNLLQLGQWADRIEEKFNIILPMVSGGNSSSIYLIEKGQLPEKINNLRLGEAFLLGNDTAYGKRLPETVDDALTVSAQIVELKEKPSLPIGEVGVDAFGQKPFYEDRGRIKRAILAIGQQDIATDSMIPIDKNIEILGASSDHLILDVTKADYRVGDVVSFKLGYGSTLKAATSSYVKKEYII